MPGVSAQEATLTVVPKLRSVPYSWRQPSLPVSLPLPRFADRAFEPTPIRSSSVVTQQYPSSPGSQVSTICIDLDDFDSDCSRSIEISYPVLSVVVDQTFLC